MNPKHIVVATEYERDVEEDAPKDVDYTDYTRLPRGVRFESLCCFSSTEGQD